MSVTTACSVRAEMLTVPAHAACSWEHEIVIGGRWRTGYSSATARARVAAITVSVARGRCAPCCSKLPIGSTATDARRSCSSAVVASGNRSVISAALLYVGGMTEHAALLDVAREAV